MKAMVLLLLALGCTNDAPAPRASSSSLRATAPPSRTAMPPISTTSRSANEGARDPWEVFDRLDDNRDRAVTPDELEVGRYLHAEELATKLDRNGDGTLTVDEIQGRGLIRIPPLGDPTKVDADANGEISTDEIDAVLANRGWGAQY